MGKKEKEGLVNGAVGRWCALEEGEWSKWHEDVDVALLVARHPGLAEYFMLILIILIWGDYYIVSKIQAMTTH